MNLKSLIPIGRDRTVASRESNPFATLQREVDRLFDEFTRGFAAPRWPTLPTWSAPDLMPSMDVTETDKEIEITAELPGLEEKDVQINLVDNVLTITGEKKEEKEEKEKNYRLLERSYGSFSRTLELPAGIEPDAVRPPSPRGCSR
jgi:HSP20 family protein